MNTVYIKDNPSKKTIETIISKQFKDWIIDIEFIYESYFENTRKLRNFVEYICNFLWLPLTDTVKFILIIDELNNNAIEYWTEEWWINKMRFKCNKDKNNIYINIEVEDTWKWKKHKNVLEMETLRTHQLKLWYWKHKSIRWRWLFMIVVNSVDRLYFKNSKNWWLIVWIKKNIKI